VTKFVPPGFDAAAARQGILNAMAFGEPTRTEDKAWFYFPKTVSSDVGTPADQDDIPFDPDVTVTGETTTDSKPRQQVSCAVEYVDAGAVLGPETFGGVRASRIKITLLDTEYQQIKGFSFVVAGGDKYVHDSTEPPVALGTFDVWTVHATAEDES
jgi:hypothetical protein